MDNNERRHRRKLGDMTVLEARGWLIQQLIGVELMVDNIIEAYYQPSDQDHFRDVMLNPSVMHLGSKIRVIINMGSDKKVIEHLRTLLTIRNAFAHTDISEVLNVRMSGDELSVKEVHEISYMNSRSEIKKKDAKDLLEEFKKSHKIVTNGLYTQYIKIINPNQPLS